MRLMLDTCVVIDMLTDIERLGKGALSLIDDPENTLFASVETVRELVAHFNNKKLLAKHWRSAEKLIHYVEDDLGIDFLPIRRDVGYTYSRLLLNVEQDHRDPSDHVIIAHAITEHIPLLSSDTRFWFYRNQGLNLIEY